MSEANTNEVLNRLHVVHYRSLPIYLSFAKPWAMRGSEQALEILEQIVADQRSIIDRIGSMILDNRGNVDPGEFPIEFTGYHDLSYEFLVGKMIENQKRDIAIIEDCVAQLNFAPMAKSLAQESLGVAKAHLDTLVELNGKSSGT